MTESRSLGCFAEASDALLRRLGVDGAYLAAGRSFFTAETHLMHLGQGVLDDAPTVTAQVLAADAKRLHVFQGLGRADGLRLATAEQTLLNVDLQAGRAVAAEGVALAATTELARAHAALPRPAGAGRAVGAGRGAAAP